MSRNAEEKCEISVFRLGGGERKKAQDKVLEEDNRKQILCR